MGPYARVKRNYKDIFGENRKKNPYYEADNTMVPVLAGDPVKKVPFAKERKKKRNRSLSSEKEKALPNGTPSIDSANGHVKTSETVEPSEVSTHAKEE